jgi:hypothetical protein
MDKYRDSLDRNEDSKRETMRLNPKTAALIREVEKRLGLTWPIKYEVGDLKTCQIDSSKENGHEITINFSAAMGERDADVAHELCHAHLAEKIDPSFACARYKPEMMEHPHFESRLPQFFLSMIGMDAWTNEVRHNFFPEFTYTDLTELEEKILMICNSNEPLDDEILAGIAEHLYAAKKYGFKTKVADVVKKKLPKRAKRVVLELVEVFEKMPVLEFNPVKDLPKLEALTQSRAKAFGYAIKPKLVFEDNAWVWQF